MFCRYEREYSVLHSGTNIKDEGDDRGGQQLDELNIPSKLAVPTQTGSIKGLWPIMFLISHFPIFT